jgi:hypothetical protein
MSGSDNFHFFQPVDLCDYIYLIILITDDIDYNLEVIALFKEITIAARCVLLEVILIDLA